MPALKPVFQNIIDSEEPLPDAIYGNRYRCACTLRDGTYLPCVVLQSRSKLVDLAKRRISEERAGKGRIGGPDPYGQVVAAFLGGNRVADYDVVAAEKSRFAIPHTLLSKIHGETCMSWTGWVFEMAGGRLFSYGCGGSGFEFFQLPEGYRFNDVRAVHNHSYVDAAGEIRPLPRGIPVSFPNDYDRMAIFRDRPYFVCNIDGI